MLRESSRSLEGNYRCAGMAASTPAGSPPAAKGQLLLATPPLANSWSAASWYPSRDTKGTFHAKTGSIKDRNGRDLTEAEDIKRGGKNTQNNYTKKIIMTQIITKVGSLT